MSIASLAEDSALRLSTSSTGPTATTRALSDGQPFAVSDSTLSRLVRFVPTETITLYVAFAAAVRAADPADGAADCGDSPALAWAGFIVALLLTGALTLGLSYRAQRSAAPRKPYRWPVTETVLAMSAFAVWGLSLESTPLRSLCGYDDGVWSPVLLLSGSLLIPAVAQVVGAGASWQKTAQD
ncbi:hypothetical protein [Kineococcus gypseus]|uniref:hypothetical protein n=1 Tax=Kineococcus gypseus TaxID=1637102 RepID=UPI003D7C813A